MGSLEGGLVEHSWLGSRYRGGLDSNGFICHRCMTNKDGGVCDTCKSVQTSTDNLVAALGSGGLLTAGRLSVTPLAHSVIVDVIEVGLGQGDKGGKIGLVLSLHIGDGETSGRLLADNGTETGLGLDNAVWDTTSLAQAGQPADDLDGVDIVGDDNA